MSEVLHSKITFCYKNYALSDAYHHGETALRDHYTAIVRKSNIGLKQMILQFLSNSKDIYILFFGKKHNTFFNMLSIKDSLV